jgi:hypothetical protein
VFEVLENSNNKWLRVHTISDDYTGWLDEKQVQLIAHTTFKEMSAGRLFPCREKWARRKQVPRHTIVCQEVRSRFLRVIFSP